MLSKLYLEKFTILTLFAYTALLISLFFFPQDSAFLDAAVREREEELIRRTLEALLDMRIKFPGKTDEEAEMILESVSVSDSESYEKRRKQ